jgi:hypothetical protein
LAKGEDQQHVQNIGHDLQQLFVECAAYGLQLAHARATEIIELIAPIHLDHRLRYTMPGTTEIPNHQDLEDFCEDLMTKAFAAHRTAFPPKPAYALIPTATRNP